MNWSNVLHPYRSFTFSKKYSLPIVIKFRVKHYQLVGKAE